MMKLLLVMTTLTKRCVIKVYAHIHCLYECAGLCTYVTLHQEYLHIVSLTDDDCCLLSG